jgi:ferredoxin-type protein NapF
MAWIDKISGHQRIRTISALIAVLLALPLGWKEITGFYVWLSPFLMLNSFFVLKSVVWLNSLAFIVLILAIIKERWFCRFVCPVGWGCDRVSSFSKRRNFTLKKIPFIGKWLAISSLVAALTGIPLFVLLDPVSIFNGFFVIFSQKVTLPVIISFFGLPLLLAIHLIFPRIWCSRLCPLGGLQDEITAVKRILFKKISPEEEIKRPEHSTERRLFLSSGAGLTAGLLFPAFVKHKETKYLKPPGALNDKLFSILCVRCGNCIKSCPTGIITHRDDSGNKVSWMVPEVRFSDGYCLENCILCGQVCPSGAITPFRPTDKKRLTIGWAVINTDGCLLLNNTECNRCKAACSFDAITIEMRAGAFQMGPVVNLENCIGCGACAVICPPAVISIIPAGQT